MSGEEKMRGKVTDFICDSHCHLDFAKFDQDREEVIARARAAGVQVMGRHLFPLLGEGFVDWDAFCKAIEEVGYEGFMSVEFESFRYYEQILDRDIEKTATMSLEQVRKLLL